jgi:RNA polymerase sigma factor (sigma-70 family)
MPSLPETRASLIVRLPDAADARAWDDFVALYAPLVYRLARKHGLQPADSDDLVQDVLAAVARSVETWLARDDRGPFRAWLLRIAKNTAMNALTRQKHKATGSGDSDVARRLAQQASKNGDAGTEFDLEYRRELFRWAAERVREEVTDRTWQAFWRSTVEEQPIAAVAEQLEMSVGSVYIARSRVMARMREAVAQVNDETTIASAMVPEPE